MKGDFTRDTFDAVDHFSRVLMQQGRVQLDADWNEQVSILLHYVRTLAADLLGPGAGTASGFNIIPLAAPLTVPPTTPPTTDSKTVTNNFGIQAGHYYVDGILCENDALCAFTGQSYKPDSLQYSDKLLVYLDVWELFVTAIDDKTIRESALGGPDTAARAQVMWQVKVHGKEPGTNVALPADFDRTKVNKYWDAWVKEWQPDARGKLKALVEKPEVNADPCIQSPDSKYRGHANQLYRIEIHRGGPVEEATFKWSRDNGSVAAAWLQPEEDTSPNGILVSHTRGFEEGDWVELTHDDLELMGEPGKLVKIAAVNGDVLLTEDRDHSGDANAWNKNYKNPKVRRWNQSERGDVILVGDAIPIKSNGNQPIELEDGLQVQFDYSAGTIYRSGDYWLIPARVATGGIEWPRDAKNNAIAVPPHGVTHHYAPLAVIAVNAGGEVNVNDGDCRCVIEPPIICVPKP